MTNKKIFKLNKWDKDTIDDILIDIPIKQDVYLSLFDINTEGVLYIDYNGKMRIVGSVNPDRFMLLNCIDGLFITNKPDYNLKLLEQVRLLTCIPFEFLNSLFIDRLLYKCESLVNAYKVQQLIVRKTGFTVGIDSYNDTFYVYIKLNKLDNLLSGVEL